MNNQYNEEAKNKFSNTKEYKEFESKNYSDEELNDKGEKIMYIFCEFGNVIGNMEEGIKLVQKLKDYISNNFYSCNNDVLLGLGEMYISNIEMKKNIDGASGEGTSEFVYKCIKEYIKNDKR